jgi:hypothetical protein
VTTKVNQRRERGIVRQSDHSSQENFRFKSRNCLDQFAINGSHGAFEDRCSRDQLGPSDCFKPLGSAYFCLSSKNVSKFNKIIGNKVQRKMPSI